MIKNGSERKKKSVDWLFDAPMEINLASQFDEDVLNALGLNVVQTYEMDLNARSDWDRRSESALKFAKQNMDNKTFPWPGASNVCHPLITTAAIQFAARAYPEIVKGNKVVKCQVTGDDPVVKSGADQMSPLMNAPLQPGAEAAGPPQGAMPTPPQMSGPPMPPQAGGPGPATQPGQQMAGPQAVAKQMGEMAPPGAVFGPGQGPVKPPIKEKRNRADRIAVHMNWQLTQEMPEWCSDMDRMLHILPVLGQCYKKVFRNTLYGRNESELVLPMNCVVSAGAKSIKTARRVTHQLFLYENDVWERMQAGTWLDVDLGLPPTVDNDPDAAHEFLEQHRFEDLDGDGYKEPYIVTVHRQSAKVVRVFARWEPEEVRVSVVGQKSVLDRIEPDVYFIHYGFMPNPDGSINYMGFGQLLEPINAAVNASLNQLIDSGTLYNAGGGFIGRGVKIRGGEFAFRPGEWKLLDTMGTTLKESLVPLPTREPSAVLFQLLGFLVQAGRDITSVQDVLAGDARLAANMPVGTAMALVEQGLKVFTAIYKRIYGSLTDEFKRLYTLNARYLDPTVSFEMAGHPEMFTGRGDYVEGDLSVVPVADPDLSSDMQRMLKGQALKDLSGRPGLNELELTRRLVRAIQPEDIDDILLTDGQLAGKEPLPWKPPPTPEQIVAQAKATRMQQQAQEANVRLQMDAAKFHLDVEGLIADIAKKKADTMLAIAKAEKESAMIGEAEAKRHLDVYKIEMDQITAQVQMHAQMVQEQMKMAQQQSMQQAKMQGQQGGPANPSSGSGQQPPIRMMADGGQLPVGQTAVVGERGPELITAGKGGTTVVPLSGSSERTNPFAGMTPDELRAAQHEYIKMSTSLYDNMEDNKGNVPINEYQSSIKPIVNMEDATKKAMYPSALPVLNADISALRKAGIKFDEGKLREQVYNLGDYDKMPDWFIGEAAKYKNWKERSFVESGALRNPGGYFYLEQWDSSDKSKPGKFASYYSKDNARAFINSAKKFGVDPEVAAAIPIVESKLGLDDKGSASIGKNIAHAWYSGVPNEASLQEHADGAIKMLRKLIDKRGLREGIHAYNGLGKGPTKDYAGRVLEVVDVLKKNKDFQALVKGK